jgi:hypothetical protein
MGALLIGYNERRVHDMQQLAQMRRASAAGPD